MPSWVAENPPCWLVKATLHLSKTKPAIPPGSSGAFKRGARSGHLYSQHLDFIRKGTKDGVPKRVREQMKSNSESFLVKYPLEELKSVVYKEELHYVEDYLEGFARGIKTFRGTFSPARETSGDAIYRMLVDNIEEVEAMRMFTNCHKMLDEWLRTKLSANTVGSYERVRQLFQRIGLTCFCRKSKV